MSDLPARPKLLVFGGGREADEAVLRLLRGACDVHLTTELGDALDRLRAEPFDAVLAASNDFLPLERALGREQAASILDAVSEGACVVGLSGRLLWANEKFKAMGPDVGAEIVRRVHEAATETNAARTMFIDDQHQYEIAVSVLRSRSAKPTHVSAVVFDTTDAARLHQKMEAMGDAGRELVGLEGGDIARMNVGERLQFLEERIVHYAGELIGREHFALWVVDERSGALNLIAAKGMPADAGDRSLPLGEAGGLPGLVAVGGTSWLCLDHAAEPQYKPAALPDARSSLSVPVRLGSRVIGVLGFESHRTDTFTESDRQFIEIFAGYIALALNTLNLLTVERYSATTEITGVVTSELGGPLADIRREAQALIAEYIGHDDMRKRLERIVATTDSIEQTVEDIAAQPGAAVMGSMAPASNADPLLTGKRVLVADDEELIRDTIHDVLVRAGAVVEVAADGREAIEKVGAGSFDLVLSDIKMPYHNGYEVFAAAKARDESTAVILITGFGYDPTHSVVRANREGLAAVLFKPFKVQQLLDEVRGALTPA